MTPDFLIIGAMKAGTTSLAFQLDAHPEIAMSHPKEPDFFAREEAWGRGWDWYDNCFSHSPEKPVRGDASTAYAKSPLYDGVARRVAENCPDVKIVYLVRNPVDRILSQYRHRWYGRYIPKDCTFGAYLQLDETAIQFSRYYYQLSKYLDHFDASRIKVVVSEDYYSDPEAVSRDLYDFLGVRSDWVPDSYEVRNSSEVKVRKSPWLVKLRQSRLIPPGIKNMISPQWRQRIRNFRGATTAPLANVADYRDELLDIFMPDVQCLSDYLGRDMESFWKLNVPLMTGLGNGAIRAAS